MSIVTALRDYVELMNNVYDSFSGNLTIQTVIQQTLLYLFSSIKYFIFYVISFQWLRDLCYLPIIVPQISVSLLKGQFFLENPLSNFFTFLEPATYSNNSFFIGFLNSFFLSLPVSCAHLVFVRRLFIQGDIAGLAAGFGTIFGHIWFLTCVLFGLRFFIVPWFSFEPLPYILGFILILSIIYDMASERAIKRIKIDETKLLVKFFFLNFALTWTEQASIFQYLGNLTFGAEPTILENFSSKNEIQYFITHFSYLFGLLVGHCLFMFLFGVLLKKLYQFIYVQFFPFVEGTWIRKLNFGLLVTLIGLSISTIPYYTVEYLLLKPAGFISQDQSFRNTPFDPTGPKDTIELLGGTSQYRSLDTDISVFGRGRYLKVPQNQSFEDLNYKGEYSWVTRYDRTRSIGENRDNAKRFMQNVLKSESLADSQKFRKRDPSDSLFIKTWDDSAAIPDFGSSQYQTVRRRFENQYVKNQIAYYPFNQFLKGQFPPSYIKDDPTRPQKTLEKAIKQKYYSNPVYKFLLSLDIDTFLAGQPKNYRLSPEEEKNLLQKRLLLANYYDSLRMYRNLPYINEFENLFSGSKSFADRVYNQQFKGTLRVVRRLFSISLNSDSPELSLKYDQPLFKKETDLNNSIFHEELQNRDNQINPFIELANGTPFYAGWDEQLRKLVITNRLLPRSTSLYSSRNPRSNTKIEFSAWPIPKNVLSQLKEPDNIISLSKEKKAKKQPPELTYSVLFESVEKNPLIKNYFVDPYESDFARDSYSYKTLPANVVRLTPTPLPTGKNVIPPTRGGFLWYGNESLKFDFESLVKK